MPFDGRYVGNEKEFKEDAFMALESRFADRTSFEGFFDSLETPEKKDEFLRVTSSYLFLVKRGDWHIAVDGYNQVIDYFTNSFKLVSLFSLIESLTELKHQDFYQWLTHRGKTTVFPISDKSELKGLYDEYKKSFGSIRRCVGFFEQLPNHQKEVLCQSIQIGNAPIGTIKKLAQFLYNLRSEFVHSANLVLFVNDSTTYHIGKKGLTRSKLSLDILLDAFEEGIISYFKNET